MKLVPEWRAAWRWFSVQSMGAAVAMQGAWLALSPDLKARVPDNLVDALTIGVLVLGVVGRLVDQGGSK